MENWDFLALVWSVYKIYSVHTPIHEAMYTYIHKKEVASFPLLPWWAPVA